jgi:hypothetical protein
MQIWLDSFSLVTKGLPMSVPEYGALLSDHVRALSEARFHRRVGQEQGPLARSIKP